MKIRTDPRSVVTDAVAMAISTMEHVCVATPADREQLTAALGSYAGDTTRTTDAIVGDVLKLTQDILTTPADKRSISRVIALLAAGSIVPDMTDPLTQFLGTVTDFPSDAGTAPWVRLDDHLDAEFMSQFTPEWWGLANTMLDAIYLDTLEQTGERLPPLSLIMYGVLPPMMDVLYRAGSPEFGSFPGEILLTMFADVVAKELLQALPNIPLPLADWANEHHTYAPHN